MNIVRAGAETRQVAADLAAYGVGWTDAVYGDTEAEHRRAQARASARAKTLAKIFGTPVHYVTAWDDDVRLFVFYR